MNVVVVFRRLGWLPYIDQSTLEIHIILLPRASTMIIISKVYQGTATYLGCLLITATPSHASTFPGLLGTLRGLLGNIGQVRLYTRSAVPDA